VEEDEGDVSLLSLLLLLLVVVLLFPDAVDAIPAVCLTVSLLCRRKADGMMIMDFVGFFILPVYIARISWLRQKEIHNIANLLSTPFNYE
jgi:hypothetical protein